VPKVRFILKVNSHIPTILRLVDVKGTAIVNVLDGGIYDAVAAR
jgi:hypothetical protein